MRDSSTRAAGQLAAGWLSHRRGWYDKAWEDFAGYETEMLARLVPVPAFESALLSTSGSREVAEQIAERVERLGPKAAAHLARRQLVRGEVASSRALAPRRPEQQS